jgi:hypothetical protein
VLVRFLPYLHLASLVLDEGYAPSGNYVADGQNTKVPFTLLLFINTISIKIYHIII